MVLVDAICMVMPRPIKSIRNRLSGKDELREKMISTRLTATPRLIITVGNPLIVLRLAR